MNIIVGTYFLIISIGYILNTVTNCYLGMLNGMGKPSKSMLLMIFYYIIVRMPLACLLSHLGFGLNGIWTAVLVSHVVASLAAAITGTILVKNESMNEYAYILTEARKVNPQKFEAAFYTKPDLRNVRPPEEPANIECT